MKKRTCERCVAFRMEQYHSKCLLGFDIDQTKLAPMGECPKPLTVKEYYRLFNEKYTRKAP